MLFAMAEKKAILNLRVEPGVLDQFKIAAKLRGASMSGLLHQFIIRTIREEKAEMPQEFAPRGVRAVKAPVVMTISPGRKAEAEPTKDDVRKMITSEQEDAIARQLKPRKKRRA